VRGEPTTTQLGVLPPFNPYYPTGTYASMNKPKHCDLLEMSVSPHLIIPGMTRTGKTLLTSSIIEEQYGEMKIIHLHNPDVIEGGFKRFPAHGLFAEILKKQGIEPIGFDTKVYCPVDINRLPSQLPDFFELYSIPVDDYPNLWGENLSILGNAQTSTTVKSAFDVALQKTQNTRQPTFASFFMEIQRVLKYGFETEIGATFRIADARSKQTIDRTLHKLAVASTISSGDCELAMTNDRFIKILDNISEISVFCQTFLPAYWVDPTIKRFHVMYILEKIMKLADEVKHPILIVCNELHNLATDPAGTQDMSARAVSSQITNLVKTIRKFNVRFVADSQTYSELNPWLVKECDVVSFLNYGDYKLRERADDPNKVDGILRSLHPDHKHGVYRYYHFGMDDVFSVQLPRSDHPMEGYQNLFRIASNNGCKWYDTKPLTEPIVEGAKEAFHTTKKAIEEMRREEEKGAFTCDICGKQLKSQQGLSNHIRIKHSEVWESKRATTDSIQAT